MFPDAAACLENIPGDRQIPDHPLVSQTIRDCLEEAMDFDGLARVLTRIHAGELRLVTRDTPEPSPISHEILNARPYAFLDDAPLEERRTQAVYARRATEPSSAKDIGALDPPAIERVRDEAHARSARRRRAARRAGHGRVPDGRRRARGLPQPLFRRARRVTPLCHAFGPLWIAAERVPELLAVHPEARLLRQSVAPPARATRGWSREEAIVELVRGRVSIAGPTTAGELAGALVVGRGGRRRWRCSISKQQGIVLRGRFSGGNGLEFCDRALLARIHRYTLNRLRAEIEPVSVGRLHALSVRLAAR